MTLVVDASVAVKWLIDEAGSDAAADLRGQVLLAPSLIRLEVGNTLRTLSARGVLDAAAAEEAFGLFLTAPLIIVDPDAQALAGALELALSLGHPIYDCVYLTLALIEGCPLVTADRRFAAALARGGVEADVRVLGG